MLTDDSQTIQESFIEGNEDFIKRNAKLALEEVPLPKRRDKFIEEDIAIKVNVAKHLGLDEFDKDYYREKIEMKKREMIEGKNPLLSTRQIQNEGGLLGDLDDDREQYVLGGLSRTISKAMSKMMGKGSKEKFSPKNLVEEYEALSPKQYKKRFDKDPSKVKKGKDFDMMMINEVNLSATERAFVKERYPDFTGNTAADVYKHTKSEQVVRDMYANNQRVGIAHGGEPLPNKGLEELHKEEPDVVAKMLREQKQEGGDMDMQMSMLMDKPEPEKEMLPDEEMEDNYIDFILDEALSEEEEDMLMSKLEQDEQLSMLFDKVIEVASEFAGSGPVEGPGSGVSDSIPARLSDGEFVFTAKSVEEIGADNLMAMMKEAEMRADERQGMQDGGDVEEEMVTMQPNQEPVQQEIRVVKETIDSPNRMIADEDEISKSIKTNMMLDPMQRHVRS